MIEVAGKRFLVVGLGASGEAAARALAERGATVRVTEGSTSDAIERRAESLKRTGIEVETGRHTFHRDPLEVAVMSPGIPPAARIWKELRSRHVTVIGEVELAYRLMARPILAVTGTNGKTTTTSLLGKMLEEGGHDAMVAGNIGTPLIEAAELSSPGVVAAEVSSFQLWSIDTFRPRVAVILNIAEDHTDWHGSLEAYAQAKARIFENQTTDDVLVFNADDPTTASIVTSARSRLVPFSATRASATGTGVDGGAVVWRGAKVFALEDVPIAGAAGAEDAVAAATAALEYGVEVDAVARAVKTFEPLPHRMQVVARHNGVVYIDDSKATNPHATLAAVRGLRDVVLIAGGRSKGIDLRPLSATVPPVVAVIALGEAQDELERVFAQRVPVERARDMDDAVARAYARSIRGGSVLLAPACASLDMYENYASRGRAFVRAVEQVVAPEMPAGKGNGRRGDGHA